MGPLVIAATSRSTLASLRCELRDASPKTKNLDAVRDGEHLGHVVADENDGDALVANLLDQVEHASSLDDAQRCGGLVHEDDAVRPHRGARDRDRLTLPAGQGGYRSARRAKPDAQALELLARLPAHRRAVDEAELAEQARQDDLPAEKQILERRQIGGKREILVDRRNAMSLRVIGGIECDRLAGQKDLPLVRPVRAGEDLHQRRLAGAVVADKRADFSRLDGEVRAIESAHMPEAARDRTGFEQRRHLRRTFGRKTDIVRESVQFPVSRSG